MHFTIDALLKDEPKKFLGLGKFLDILISFRTNYRNIVPYSAFMASSPVAFVDSILSTNPLNSTLIFYSNNQHNRSSIITGASPSTKCYEREICRNSNSWLSSLFKA